MEFLRALSKLPFTYAYLGVTGWHKNLPQEHTQPTTYGKLHITCLQLLIQQNFMEISKLNFQLFDRNFFNAAYQILEYFAKTVASPTKSI